MQYRKGNGVYDSERITLTGDHMTSLPFKLLVCTLGLGVVLSSNADAAKKPKPVAPQYVAENSAHCRGAGQFPCGPIYNGKDYLGEDPDPFIRSMIQRDLSAKYGGAD